MDTANIACPACQSNNIVGTHFCKECGHKFPSVNSDFTYHLVVMGSGGTGKSALTICFVNRQFEGLKDENSYSFSAAKYDPLIEDRYVSKGNVPTNEPQQKTVTYCGVPCVLNILVSCMVQQYFDHSVGYSRSRNFFCNEGIVHEKW